MRGQIIPQARLGSLLTNDNYSPRRRPSVLTCVPQERCHGQSVGRWIKTHIRTLLSFLVFPLRREKVSYIRNMQNALTGDPELGIGQRGAPDTSPIGIKLPKHSLHERAMTKWWNTLLSRPRCTWIPIGLVSLHERPMTKWWSTLHIAPEACGFQSLFCLGTNQAFNFVPLLVIYKSLRSPKHSLHEQAMTK